MAPIITPVSAILAGKVHIRLRVRVIHMWTVPEYNNPQEDGVLHMLLMDEKLGKIQASAKKHLLPKVKSRVELGSAYEIENVLVTHNEPKFPTTAHKWRLNLIDRTKFNTIDGCNIPLNHFDFISFSEILESPKEDRIVDVIGHVVEKEDIVEKTINGRKIKLMEVTLQDSESRRIHCTLWANYAERLSAFMASHDPTSPVVVVLQLCKLKKYCGVMGVSNTFYGTNLILNSDQAEIVEYKSKIDGDDVQVTQGVSQQTQNSIVSVADDMLQSRKMTIEELIESTDQGVGIVLATVCDIESEYGWYYQSCTKCAGRVKTVAGRLFCPKCNTGRNAVPRYKLHVQVMDETGSTSFILFDRNVTNFVNRSVQDLIDAQADNSTELPSEFDILIGKPILFKVEVTDGNLRHNWRNYAVKRTSSDPDVIKRFMILHNIKAMDDEVGTETDPCYPSVDLAVEIPLLECGDSTKSQSNPTGDDVTVSGDVIELTDFEKTPCSKKSGKRSVEKAMLIEKKNAELGEESATKPVKLKCVKQEPVN